MERIKTRQIVLIEDKSDCKTVIGKTMEKTLLQISKKVRMNIRYICVNGE